MTAGVYDLGPAKPDMYDMHDHGPGTESHSHSTQQDHTGNINNRFANDHNGVRVLPWDQWKKEMIRRKPRPLRVFYYQGGWRWACRFNKGSVSFFQLFPHASGPSSNRAYGYRCPGDAADDARRHFRLYHFDCTGVPK